MSILVKGLEMPKKGRCIDIVILDDGTVIYYDDCYKKIGGAVELPDHGDLIDESEKVNAQYYDEEHEDWLIKSKTVGEILSEVCEVPPKVVIPAERSEE